MATSISLSNFLSFLLPSNPPPKPTSQLSFPSSKIQSLSQNSKGKLIPLVAGEGHSTSLSPELSAVVNPSLANANTLFFKSAYNVQVIVEDNEPEEKLLNRFRREVMRAGVIQECKRRRFYENKQDEKKRKSREAAKRNRRRRPQSRSFTQNRQETATTNKKEEDDEDNWDLPEGDIPY